MKNQSVYQISLLVSLAVASIYGQDNDGNRKLVINEKNTGNSSVLQHKDFIELKLICKRKPKEFSLHLLLELELDEKKTIPDHQ